MRSNVYYNPEHWGLTKIDELENSTGCYEFDTHLLLQHEDGTLYYCHDAGCSCPTPFEDYNLSNMTVITQEGFESFRDSMFNLKRDHCTIGEVNDFVDAARRALIWSWRIAVWNCDVHETSSFYFKLEVNIFFDN